MSNHQSILDYDVVNVDQFQGKTKNSLEKLPQKSAKPFTFSTPSFKFAIQIRLVKPALLKSIELKVKDVSSVQIWRVDGKRSYRQQKKTLSVDEMKGKTFIIPFEGVPIEKELQIYLMNDIPTQSTIHYAILKGITNQEPFKKPIKNVSKDDEEFRPSTKKILGSKEKEIFNRRMKTRQTSATTRKKNDSVSHDYVDLQENDESADLKKALQLSKKEHQKQSLGVYDQFPVQSPIDYQLMPYSSRIEKIFSNVTSSWIQAQKKAQQSMNVKEVHSLAQKMPVKCFSDLQFFINGIFSTQRIKLSNKIKEMGGKVRDTPVDDCIVVTNRMEGEKIMEFKKMKGVKFVTPDFVYDSEKVKMKLMEDDYAL